MVLIGCFPRFNLGKYRTDSNRQGAKHSGTKYWFLAEIYRPNASPLHQTVKFDLRKFYEFNSVEKDDRIHYLPKFYNPATSKQREKFCQHNGSIRKQYQVNESDYKT